MNLTPPAPKYHGGVQHMILQNIVGFPPPVEMTSVLADVKPTSQNTD